MDSTTGTQDSGADIRKVLQGLGIHFGELAHGPVRTIAEASFVKERLPGLGCKNLFLCAGKRHFLVCLRDDKHCDLRTLAKVLGTGRLQFAGPEALNALLKLAPGAVSPLGLVNDVDGRVEPVFDKDFVGQMVLVHPNVNTATLSLTFADLLRLVRSTGHDWVLAAL